MIFGQMWLIAINDYMVIERKTGNLIVDLTTEFAIAILEYCDKLMSSHHYTIANQLSRSATSIGANVAEAQSSESASDFIHKMKIAQKEAHETEYWLKLCKFANGYAYDESYEQQLLSILLMKDIRICMADRSGFQL